MHSKVRRYDGKTQDQGKLGIRWIRVWMQILYLDSSGQVTRFIPKKTTRHYVLAGLVAKPEIWHQANLELNRLKTEYFPDPSARPKEFHCRILQKGRSPYDKIDRFALERDLLDLTVKLNATIFGMTLDKVLHWQQYAYPWPPHIHMLEAMMNRFQWFLERTDEVGLIVSDEPGNSKERIELLNAVEHYKTSGTMFKPLKNVIDTIFFTPSETSVFLQLVDFCAYAIFRFVEHKDSVRYDRIRSRVDPYGLRHFP